MDKNIVYLIKAIQIKGRMLTLNIHKSIIVSNTKGSKGLK